jgi:hypothetical protein
VGVIGCDDLHIMFGRKFEQGLIHFLLLRNTMSL